MKPLGLHNIHYRAQCDLANRKVGVRAPLGGTPLVAHSRSAVKTLPPFLRPSVPVVPVLQPRSEVLCVDGSSTSGAASAVSSHCWLRLRRHSQLLLLSRDRLFLKCQTCGCETPGWEFTEAPPRLRFAGDPRRHTGWLTTGPPNGRPG